MPCQSAYRKKDNNVESKERAKTAVPKKDRYYRNKPRIYSHKCMENDINRGNPYEVDFNDALKVMAVGNCPKASGKQKYRMYPTFLSLKEMERLKNASKVVSLEEKVAEIELQMQEHRRITEECEKRKQLLKEIDDAKMKAKIERDKQKPQDLDDLGEDNKHKVLERAFLAKHEQEEEVKKANRIILEAKCHVIREAQVVEKNELAREIKAEERRLEKMMLEEQEKAFKEDIEQIQQQQEQKLKYANEIKRQLEERELLKMKEANRIEEEAKIRKVANAAIQKDEEKKAKIEKEKRAKLRADLQRIADMSQKFKQMEFEQQRAAEMRVLEYMRMKEARDKQLALEKKLSKEAMERQQEKLISKQAKYLETKTEKQEMDIRREQERKEREYRQKEKEAVLKKKQLEKELDQARKIQMDDIKRRQALKIARDEADFKMIVQKLKDEQAKEKRLEELRLRNKDKYREEIISQMKQKEMERKELQQRAKNEYLAWLEKEKTRDRNIRTVIQAKLNQMREANMPEKYIKDVEKQLRIAAN